MRLLTLRELKDNPDLLLELSYPSRDLGYASMILEELEGCGVDGIYVEVEGGGELVKLGKGYRGVVFRGRMRGEDVALKVLRTDSTLRDLIEEAENTKLANSVGIGARLRASSKHVIALEYIDGVDLDTWLKGLDVGEVRSLKMVLASCFRQARALDEIGLDHGELGDARRHIILRRNLSPVIIDFGKASRRRRPSNVTSFFSYVTFGRHSSKILKMLGLSKPPIDSSRMYKLRMDEESFNKLLSSLNLI